MTRQFSYAAVFEATEEGCFVVLFLDIPGLATQEGRSTKPERWRPIVFARIWNLWRWMANVGCPSMFLSCEVLAVANIR